MTRTTRRATLATKLVLPAAAALALAGAWTAMAPAEDAAPTASGYVGLDPGTGEQILFREVVALTAEAVPGDKRDQPKRASVVLRRGLGAGNELWTWHAQVRAGDPAARRSASLTMYDTAGAPVLRWQLAAARPTKVQASQLKADGNEVAIETVEIAAEGIDIDP